MREAVSTTNWTDSAPLLVAEESLEGALPCPAAVAVHDDGYVLGDLVGVELGGIRSALRK